MYQTQDKIVSLDKARARVHHWRVHDQTLVFTNGCFDLLHLGHIDYLEKARHLGDVLIIGLNTDASVSRLKGPSRPITSENSRARVLAALEFVDMVVLFDEETPYNLIQTLAPDVLVKGGDYQVENIVGYDVVTKRGGKVLTLELVEGYSTTNIIDKILKYG